MERRFKYNVVKLILEGRVEDALKDLSARYKVKPPVVKVGSVKAHRRHPAVYVPRRQVIQVFRREALKNPLIILHEFYHHLRSFRGERTVEKKADAFAKAYWEAYSDEKVEGEETASIVKPSRKHEVNM